MVYVLKRSGARCRSHGHPVNELRYPIARRWGLNNATCPGNAPSDSKLCALKIGHGMHDTPQLASIARVALFHYVTRSRADFAAKAARGGGLNPVGKPWNFFDSVARFVFHLTTTLLNASWLSSRSLGCCYCKPCCDMLALCEL